MKCVAILLIMFGLGSTVYANDKKLKNETELSFMKTGGNTETTKFSAKNNLEYKFTDKVEVSWKIGANYGENNGEKDSENYFTELKSNYNLTERLYSSVFASWMQDKFTAIDSRYAIGPLVGYKILLGPKHKLSSEAGVSYVNEEYTDEIDESDTDYLAGRTSAEYEYLFTDKTRFSQWIELIYDFEESDNYNVNSETAIISSLNGFLSLKTSYELKYDNKPASSELDDTDTVLSVTLLINF